MFLLQFQLSQLHLCIHLEHLKDPGHLKDQLGVFLAQIQTDQVMHSHKLTRLLLNLTEVSERKIGEKKSQDRKWNNSYKTVLFRQNDIRNNLLAVRNVENQNLP